jgi:hypothetical protein
MPEQLLQTEQKSSPRRSLECRVYARQPCDLTVACQPTAAWGRADARWSAVLSDVSQGGACLIVRRRFEVGVGLGIELPGQDGDDPYMVLAKVVNVQATPDGAWALGCKFISELGEDELHRLLNPPHPAEPALQPAKAAPAAISPSQAASAAGKKTIANVLVQLELPSGKVVDCRIRQLTVPAAWTPVAGKSLTLRVDKSPGRQPLLRLGVVRWSPQAERWTLRCRLLNPSWEELLRALGR